MRFVTAKMLLDVACIVASWWLVVKMWWRCMYGWMRADGYTHAHPILLFRHRAAIEE